MASGEQKRHLLLLWRSHGPVARTSWPPSLSSLPVTPQDDVPAEPAEPSRRSTLSSTCAACQQHVHLVQRYLAEGKLYHRQCFRYVASSQPDPFPACLFAARSLQGEGFGDGVTPRGLAGSLCAALCCLLPPLPASPAPSHSACQLLVLLPAPKTRMFCLFTASLPHNTPTTRSAPQISFPPRCPGRC